MGTGYIAKVSMDGQDLCCKIGTTPWGAAVQREYECLAKVAISKHASTTRVPKLVGFVVDDDEQPIGILEDFIPRDSTLGSVRGKLVDVPVEQRKTWAKQISQTVEQLHDVGVVWGDAKPDNVLIHAETNDYWMIDFGGSWTVGWVDVALKETSAGDEQAVAKMMDFLAT